LLAELTELEGKTKSHGTATLADKHSPVVSGDSVTYFMLFDEH